MADTQPEFKAISCRIPVDLYDAVQELQWSLRMKPSAIIKESIAEFVRKHK